MSTDALPAGTKTAEAVAAPELAALGRAATLVALLEDLATPALVERVATLTATLGQLAALVTEPQAYEASTRLARTLPALATAAEQLRQWQQDGTWDALTEMAGLVAAVRDLATPNLTARVAETATALPESALRAQQIGALDVLAGVGVAMREARQAADGDTRRISLWNLGHAIAEPEVQRGLKLLLALAAALPRHAPSPDGSTP